MSFPCLAVSSQKQSQAPPSASPLQEIQRVVSSPLDLLFSRVGNPKVLHHSLQNMPSSPLTCSVALLWMLSGTLSQFFMLWRPEQHTIFKMKLYQCKIYLEYCLFGPTDYTVFNGLQNALSCWLPGTLVAHDEPAVNSQLQVPFCWLSSHSSPSLNMCLTLFYPRSRTWHFPLSNFMSLMIHSALICLDPLDSSENQQYFPVK